MSPSFEHQGASLGKRKGIKKGLKKERSRTSCSNIKGEDFIFRVVFRGKEELLGIEVISFYVSLREYFTGLHTAIVLRLKSWVGSSCTDLDHFKGYF